MESTSGRAVDSPVWCLLARLAGKSGVAVHLVESNTKKAAFLREAARLTGAPAVVHADAHRGFRRQFCGQGGGRHRPGAGAAQIAARPMFRRCGQKGRRRCCHKGQDVDAELTEASRYWNMASTLVPSRTDPKGRIVIIRVLQRRAGGARWGIRFAQQSGATKARHETTMSEQFEWPRPNPFEVSRPAPR